MTAAKICSDTTADSECMTGSPEPGHRDRRSGEQMGKLGTASRDAAVASGRRALPSSARTTAGGRCTSLSSSCGVRSDGGVTLEAQQCTWALTLGNRDRSAETRGIEGPVIEGVERCCERGGQAGRTDPLIQRCGLDHLVNGETMGVFIFINHGVQP